MQPHKVVSYEEWLKARKAHLKNEKALTRMRDMVARRAARAAVGQGREALRVRHNGRQEDARRPVRQATTSSSSTISCGAMTSTRLSELLARSRSRRRRAGSSHQSRCELRARVARAARQAAGLQEAPRLECRMGVVVGQRLQLRLSRLVHEGDSSRATFTITIRRSPARTRSTNCRASACSPRTMPATSITPTRATRAATRR